MANKKILIASLLLFVAVLFVGFSYWWQGKDVDLEQPTSDVTQPQETSETLTPESASHTKPIEQSDASTSEAGEEGVDNRIVTLEIDSISEWQSYSDKVFGFSLHLPTSWESADNNMFRTKHFIEQEAMGFEIQSEEGVGRIVRRYDTTIQFSSPGVATSSDWTDDLDCWKSNLNYFEPGFVTINSKEFYLCFLGPEGLTFFEYYTVHPTTKKILLFDVRPNEPETPASQSQTGAELILSTIEFE